LVTVEMTTSYSEKAVVSRELRCGALNKRKTWRDTGGGREVKGTATRRAIRQNAIISYK